MIPAALYVAFWTLRLAALALCVVAGAAFVTAPSVFVSNYGALVLGALGGFVAWCLLVFGVPDWVNRG